jgi:hypothetical protein
MIKLGEKSNKRFSTQASGYAKLFQNLADVAEIFTGVPYNNARLLVTRGGKKEKGRF